MKCDTNPEGQCPHGLPLRFAMGDRRVCTNVSSRVPARQETGRSGRRSRDVGIFRDQRHFESHYRPNTFPNLAPRADRYQSMILSKF